VSGRLHRCGCTALTAATAADTVRHRYIKREEWFLRVRLLFYTAMMIDGPQAVHGRVGWLGMLSGATGRWCAGKAHSQR
jgi:hypothetical protein